MGVGWRGSVADAKGFVDEHRIAFPMLFDTGETVFRAFEIPAQPAAVFVNPDGTVAEKRFGPVGEADIEAFIAKTG